MLKNMFLLCLAMTNALVAANPLYQTVPAQSCPICQQNAYQNTPANLPFVIQQPTSNSNPYSQLNWAQNPSTQTCQQPQAIPTCNNQVSSSSNQLNQMLFNKILSNPALRSILDPNTKLYNQNGVEIPRHMPPVHYGSSPSNVINNYIIVPPELLLNDTNINQNSKNRRMRNGEQRKNNNYNKNYCETRSNKRKSHENVYNRKDTIESSKNLRNNNRNSSRKDSNKRKEAKISQSENVCKVTGERNKQKSKRKPKNGTKGEENRTLNDDAAKETVIEKPELIEVHKIQANEKDFDNKNTYNPVGNYQVEAINENNLNLMNYQNYERALKQYNSQLNEKKSTQKSEQKYQSDSSTLQPLEKHKEANANIEKPKETNNGHSKVRLTVNAVQRNPREETVIQDLQTKFPGIPEDVVRSLLSHLKRQLQDEQLGVSNFYYPNFPFSYDQFYQMPFNSATYHNARSNYEKNHNERNNNRRRNNLRNQNKRKRQRNKNNCNTNNCESVVETVPSQFKNVSENITFATTQNPIEAKCGLNSFASSKLIEPVEVTTESNDFIETTTSKNQLSYTENIDFNTKVPELGMEDIVPTIYVNGIIDDYYPDFTADNAALVISNEEFGLRNLQEDRYHYTTDRNSETGELNRERRKYEQNFDNIYNIKRPSKINNSYKSDETDEKESLFKKEDSLRRPGELAPTDKFEEIQFRTPPTLELPDFETRRVDKVATNYQEELEYDDDDLYSDRFVNKYIDGVDKISTYSNLKTPQYNTRDKPSTERRNTRKIVKNDVETAFARSKVAKYGQNPDFLEEVEIPVSPDSLNEKKFKNDRFQYATDSDPSIVIAKSIPGEYW